MHTKWLIPGCGLLVILSFTILSCNNPSGASQQTNSSGQDTVSDAGWVSLFNGKDLSGWTQLEGKSQFTVEDNQIVATTVTHNPNSVLCTDKKYSNFVLELDIKVDSPLNSGVQIRSHLSDKGEVYGYQIEVDPSKRAWSGGIYDCRRRGWMINLDGKPEKQAAFKNGQWNHYRIRFNGDTLQSWVNEIPIATMIDTLQDPVGFIGLQADGIKQGRLHARFRNIRIKTL